MLTNSFTKLADIEKLKKKLIKSKKLYDIWAEEWFDEATMGKDEKPLKLKIARNKNGDYIGEMKMAKTLCDKFGIAPEKRKSDHCVCSIGYSAKKDKWYGWSHRGIGGFGIGG